MNRLGINDVVLVTECSGLGKVGNPAIVGHKGFKVKNFLFVFLESFVNLATFFSRLRILLQKAHD